VRYENAAFALPPPAGATLEEATEWVTVSRSSLPSQ
jgi:hypothetical protein